MKIAIATYFKCDLWFWLRWFWQLIANRTLFNSTLRDDPSFACPSLWRSLPPAIFDSNSWMTECWTLFMNIPLAFVSTIFQTKLNLTSFLLLWFVCVFFVLGTLIVASGYWFPRLNKISDTWYLSILRERVPSACRRRISRIEEDSLENYPEVQRAWNDFSPPREWQTLQVDERDAGFHQRTDEAGRWDHGNPASEDLGRAWVQGLKEHHHQSKTNAGMDIPW